MPERRTSEARGSRSLQLEWMPGIGLLAAAVGTGAVIGYTAAVGRPPFYLSLMVCALLSGLAISAWRRGRSPLELGLTRARPASHAAAAPTSPPPYDLSRDRSTDAQKYVM